MTDTTDTLNSLQIISGQQSLATMPLRHSPLLIGRAAGCDLVLQSPYISQQQARLWQVAGQWQLENLSQANPVHWQGRPLDTPVTLRPGDEFEIGPFVARLTVTPSTGAPLADATLLAMAPRTLRVAYGSVNIAYPLTAERMTVGRSSEAELVIPLRAVSRLHAVLTLDREGYTIHDQQSTNGLTFRGRRISSHRLSDGDVLRISDEIGNVITLTYQDETRPALRPVQVAAFAEGQQMLTIGRAADNNLPLDHPLVSAHHAVIRRTAAGDLLEDLGSTNGTYLGGQRISQAPLQPGATLHIGGYRLVYQPDGLARPASGHATRLDVLGLHATAAPRLHDLSLTVYPHELVAIVGPSGSGKSTLLRALGGMASHIEGRVLLDGVADPLTQRGQIGYVPQQESLHAQLTTERTLLYAARLRLPADLSEAEINQRIAAVLADVELSDQRTLTVEQLSGGQRRRLAIAIELLAQPGLLLLDEPTTGLDPALDKRIMALLRALADRSCTAVLVTHAIAHIALCDRVAVLGRDGRLCFYGPPQEALAFFDAADFASIYTQLEQQPGSAAAWEAQFRQSAYYAEYVARRLPTSEDSGHSETEQTTALPDTAQPSGPTIHAPQTFWLLTQRATELLRRDWPTLLLLLAQAPLGGLLIILLAPVGLLAAGATPADAERLIFLLVIAAVLQGASNAVRTISSERAVYHRERLLGLQAAPYVLSKLAILLPLVLVQSGLLLLVVLPTLGELPAGVLLPGPLEWWIGLSLTTLGGSMLGLLVSALAAHSTQAVSMVPLVLLPQIVLSGLIFPLFGPAELLSAATISRWGVESLGTSANLNRLYFQTFASAPPGIRDPALPGRPRRFNVAAYDSLAPPTDYTVASRQADRRAHLLWRWGILLTQIGLLLGLTWIVQRRKDRPLPRVQRGNRNRTTSGG